ncbi:MAG: hypothetical protein HYU88_01430 [Chloroflexi bacterium]|nr:hypothetical protein [Chloroflexota bacterium]
MTPSGSLILVVDASVARSAGETEDPVSAACRRFLVRAMSICYRLVMTRAIIDEWQRHQSAFSRKWLSAMTAKRKVVWLKGIPHATSIDAEGIIDPRGRQILIKDLHLLEAALSTDSIVVSRDDTCREVVQNCSPVIPVLRQIVWLNPINLDGDLDAALRNYPNRRLRRELRRWYT